MSTSGSAYLLLDNGPVLRLEKEAMKSGVYEVMNKRVSWIQRCVDLRFVAPWCGGGALRLMMNYILQCDGERVYMGGSQGRERSV